MDVYWKGRTSLTTLRIQEFHVKIATSEFLEASIKHWYDIHDLHVNGERVMIDRRNQSKEEIIRKIRAMALLTS